MPKSFIQLFIFPFEEIRLTVFTVLYEFYLSHNISIWLFGIIYKYVFYFSESFIVKCVVLFAWATLSNLLRLVYFLLFSSFNCRLRDSIFLGFESILFNFKKLLKLKNIDSNLKKIESRNLQLRNLTIKARK